MATKPSLLLDIESAELDFGCELERVSVELMVRNVAIRYRPDIDFEELLTYVIGLEPGLTDEQRHGYKFVLGREFWRRREMKRTANKKGRDT